MLDNHDRLWTLREAPFQPASYAHKETIFTIGNGYVGVRAAFEEGHPGEQALTLVHGLFNHAEGEQVPALVNAPNWFRLALTVDGTPFSVRSGRVLGYERLLDLRRAVLSRRVLWQPAPGGPVVRLEFERFASRAQQHVLALQAHVTALDKAVTIEVEAALDGNVTNEGVRHWQPWQQGSESPDQVWLLGRTTQSGYTLGMASALLNDVDAEPVYASRTNAPNTRLAFRLEKGQTATLTKLVALVTNRDADEPHVRPQQRGGESVLPMAKETLQAALRLGYDALLFEHEAAWSEDWGRSDVIIEGDERAQRAIRFALYHLLIAAPWHDEWVSIGAKTLSGLGYKGHVFWDTELFMLSPFIYTQPEVARNLLMYRFHNLAGARQKAATEGYRGALFPWESTDSGEETTPKWSLPHPETGKRERIWTGDREQHINADIAYAIHQYWRWTGDEAFMRDHGAEIVLDAARFWASRTEYNAEANRYELHDQIGPDEYHENVANSVYVNRMVVWHLEAATRVLDWLRAEYPQKAAELTGRLALTSEELALWQDIAAKMFVPFDGEKQHHVQFDGFFDLEYVDVPMYEPRVASLQSVYGVEATNKKQILKQADVVLLMALLGEELASRDVLLNNWHMYAPRCDHGSSLSAATHAWVAARLGLHKEAYAYFNEAAGTDLDNNKGNVADGIHGAACGGVWQAVVFGFAGLHLDAEGRPAAAPALPEGWRRLQFRFFYRGQRYEFTAQPGQDPQIRPL